MRYWQVLIMYPNWIKGKLKGLTVREKVKGVSELVVSVKSQTVVVYEVE